MNPTLKHIAQAMELAALIVCAVVLVPIYFVWAEREVNRVGI